MNSKTIFGETTKLSFLLIFFLFCCHFLAYSQCSNGAIGVSGAGCGCLAGCNLTAFGGPNCGGATGNCSAGQVSMIANITVPAGCTFTVNATMSNRPSCSASGGDAGDQLKVDIVGGVKAFQTGASNATLSDSYTLLGPGTIRVSGTANRADEIITYATVDGGTCPSCIVLPIELLTLNAKVKNKIVELSWATTSENNSDYFTVERSADGLNFETIAYMKGAGNSNSLVNYKNYDSSPLDGISYYRLKQTDFDGKFTYSDMIKVDPEKGTEINLYPNPSDGSNISLSLGNSSSTNIKVEIYDAMGRLVFSEIVVQSETGAYSILLASENVLARGLYQVKVIDEGGAFNEKLVVR